MASSNLTMVYYPRNFFLKIDAIRPVPMPQTEFSRTSGLETLKQAGGSLGGTTRKGDLAAVIALAIAKLIAGSPEKWLVLGMPVRPPQYPVFGKSANGASGCLNRTEAVII